MKFLDNLPIFVFATLYGCITFLPLYLWFGAISIIWCAIWLAFWCMGAFFSSLDLILDHNLKRTQYKEGSNGRIKYKRSLFLHYPLITFHLITYGAGSAVMLFVFAIFSAPEYIREIYEYFREKYARS